MMMKSQKQMKEKLKYKEMSYLTKRERISFFEGGDLMAKLTQKLTFFPSLYKFTKN